MDVFLTGLPKKHLVAISILVLLTMCLTPAETRAVGNRRRHQRKQEMFKAERAKIMKQLKNTINSLYEDKRDLRFYLRENSNGNPAWLPKINFVAIHNQSHTNSYSDWIRRIQKMYTHLIKYKVIFEHLRNVTICIHSEQYNDYINNRSRSFNRTHDKLHALISQISESMTKINESMVGIAIDRINLECFGKIVDESTCLRQDSITLRGYENSLRDWRSELHCPKGRLGRKKSDSCDAYEARLRKKTDQKNKDPRSRSGCTKNIKCDTNQSQPRRRVKSN